MVEIETILILVIAEKLRIATPIYHRVEELLGAFVGQQNREMFERDFLGGAGAKDAALP